MASISGDSVAIIKDGVSSVIQWMKQGGGDSFDRVSSRYSVFICVIFVILVSGGQYIGDPIDCWTPAEFTEQWTNYADQYCWVKNTYYVSPNEHIPIISERATREITYYQWTPAILCFEVLLFLLPLYIWKFLSAGDDYDLNQIVKEFRKAENINPVQRDKLMISIAENFDRWLSYRRPSRKNYPQKKSLRQKCSIFGRKQGFFLVLLYLFNKLLYIGISFVHFYYLDRIIGDGDQMFGVHAFHQLLDNHAWELSSFFPRITLCDFDVRKLGNNIHTYTLQCVLPFNMFYEKIYIFLWWWLVFVTGVSVIGLIKWFPSLTSACNTRYIKRYLKSLGRYESGCKQQKKMLYEFTSKYLREDGIFALRFVADSVSELRVAEMVCALHDLHLKRIKDTVEHGDDEIV